MGEWKKRGEVDKGEMKIEEKGLAVIGPV